MANTTRNNPKTCKICGINLIPSVLIILAGVSIACVVTYIIYIWHIIDSGKLSGKEICDEYQFIEKLSSDEWGDEINIFREYLQIPSVHPNVNYEPCVEFLTRQAKCLNLPIQVFYPVNDKNPVVVITWEGSHPELPSIMLNSHMDVVPVFEEYWTHPPFAAEIDENGNIFARGTQDTKSIGTQYLAAVRALKREGVTQLRRTVHIIFVPDEEMGGGLGMEGFVKTTEFQRLNIGFMLDESTSEPHEEINRIDVSYAEKISWKVEFIIYGETGHGSALLENTSGERLNFILNKFMEMRKIELLKINTLKYSMENVTSINLTLLKGGIQQNVIPPEIRVTFDIRFTIDTDLDEFERKVEGWCQEAGGNITVNYQKGLRTPPTPVDNLNLFWSVFSKSFDKFDLKIVPVILLGATDARFIRMLNIPAIGFRPILNTTMLTHANDEYLNAHIYLFGIEIYKEIIQNIASV